MSQAAPEIAEGAVVADVMLRDPKTLPAGATVGQVRELLERPSVQMVLLADAGVFTGAVTELPAGVADDEPAATVADPSPLALGPDESAATAFELAARLPHRRIVVLDEQPQVRQVAVRDRRRTGRAGEGRNGRSGKQQRPTAGDAPPQQPSPAQPSWHDPSLLVRLPMQCPCS